MFSLRKGSGHGLDCGTWSLGAVGAQAGSGQMGQLGSPIQNRGSYVRKESKGK